MQRQIGLLQCRQVACRVFYWLVPVHLACVGFKHADGKPTGASRFNGWSLMYRLDSLSLSLSLSNSLGRRTAPRETVTLVHSASNADAVKVSGRLTPEPAPLPI